MIKQVLFGVFIYCLLSGGLVAGEVKFSFDKIETWALKYSPEIKVIRGDMEIAVQDARSLLLFDNPQFGFQRESVKSGAVQEWEHIFSLSQSFHLPWVYSKKRQGFRLRKDLLETSKEIRIREVISRMKSRFIRLSILGDQRQRLAKVREILDLAAAALKARQAEGLLPPYEKNLMDVFVLNLHARVFELENQERELKNLWKTQLGIPAKEKLILTTPVTYIPLSAAIIGIHESGLSQSPGIRLRELETESMKHDLLLEKMNALPRLTLSGGYKEVSGGFKGYTLGLSINLPVFNRNHTAVNMRRIGLDIQRSQFERYKNKTLLEVREIRRRLNRYESFLSQMNPGFLDVKEGFQPVLAAYKEGVLSLNDFIGHLQTYMEAIQLYYGHLREYYGLIFRLEAITGKTFIKKL